MIRLNQVAPVADGVWKGKYFMSPIAGGVIIQPRLALSSDHMQTEKDGEITKLKNEIGSKAWPTANGGGTSDPTSHSDRYSDRTITRRLIATTSET